MAQVLISNRISTCFFRENFHIRSFGISFPTTSKKVPEEAIPKNILAEYYNAHEQPNGDIYDKRPFKLKLKAYKQYEWCSCGHSKSQPLCDGTHKIFTLGIKLKPVPFMVEETKEYWLCNCKQTLHKPFCDGTHLQNEIQSALKHFKN